jgi:tartrate dehydratase beta subunit/fumarate hydratase class I family protein
MIKLSFPFSEEEFPALKVGDEVLISGAVFAGRDVAAGRPCHPLRPA